MYRDNGFPEHRLSLVPEEPQSNTIQQYIKCIYKLI